MAARLMFASALFASISFAQPHIVSAGYSFPQPAGVAPGQVITFFVRGLNVPNAVASTDPRPTTLSGVTVTVLNSPTPAYPKALPILSVRSDPAACGGGITEYCDTTAVTLQIPYEPTCIPVDLPNVYCGSPAVKIAVQANGTTGVEFTYNLLGSAHVLNSCDALFGSPGICSPLITHANGALVNTGNPAHTGEVVTLYAVGLGNTRGGARTGVIAQSADPLAADVLMTPVFRVNNQGVARFTSAGSLLRADWAGLVKGFVGLYQINVRLPDTLPPGTLQCPGEDLNVRLVLGFFPPQDATPPEFVDLCVAK